VELGQLAPHLRGVFAGCVEIICGDLQGDRRPYGRPHPLLFDRERDTGQLADRLPLTTGGKWPLRASGSAMLSPSRIALRASSTTSTST
jgi:hypothetical protein